MTCYQKTVNFKDQRREFSATEGVESLVHEQGANFIPRFIWEAVFGSQVLSLLAECLVLLHPIQPRQLGAGHGHYPSHPN